MRLVLILHNIRSLHNVGSMFRTADAAGVEKIYLTGITPSPLNYLGKVQPKLAKVALGAEVAVPWEKINRLSSVLKKIKQEGFEIVAVEQSKKSQPYHRVAKRKKSEIAIIMGNEVTGLSPSILEKADRIVEIPMRGEKESLNVSVAAGIVLFRLRYP